MTAAAAVIIRLFCYTKGMFEDGLMTLDTLLFWHELDQFGAVECHHGSVVKLPASATCSRNLRAASHARPAFRERTTRSRTERKSSPDVCTSDFTCSL
jgi:hypothetical protein